MRHEPPPDTTAILDHILHTGWIDALTPSELKVVFALLLSGFIRNQGLPKADLDELADTINSSLAYTRRVIGSLQKQGAMLRLSLDGETRYSLNPDWQPVTTRQLRAERTP